MRDDEEGLLRRAVALGSRSAVAYKTAYMLAGESRAEAALLQRCAARYALLERLLGLLVDHSMPTGQVRGLLDEIDMDPGRYGGDIEAALTDARRSDEDLADLAAAALAAGHGPATATGSCLRDLAALIGSGRSDPQAGQPDAAETVLSSSRPARGSEHARIAGCGAAGR